jgi:hypothetical protein
MSEQPQKKRLNIPEDFEVAPSDSVQVLDTEIRIILHTLQEIGVISEPWAILTDLSSLGDFMLDKDEFEKLQEKLGINDLAEDALIVEIAAMLAAKRSSIQ